MCHAFNAPPRLVLPPDREWGSPGEAPGAGWTGMVGQLQRREVDLWEGRRRRLREERKKSKKVSAGDASRSQDLHLKVEVS